MYWIIIVIVAAAVAFWEGREEKRNPGYRSPISGEGHSWDRRYKHRHGR